MDIAGKRKMIQDELKNMPEGLLDDLLDFIRFLQFKLYTQDSSDHPLLTAYASEGSLAKDWLKPEEEEAWGDL